MHLWLALFDIDRAVLENIDIDKEILENIDIDKILNRLEFGIANRASSTCIWTSSGNLYKKKLPSDYD